MVRHSKRQPKPTERGSQYTQLLAKQRQNNQRLRTSSASNSELSPSVSVESSQASLPESSPPLEPSQPAIFTQNMDAFERAERAERGDSERPILVRSSPLFELQDDE
jgi:hypothetical protein